jgi:antitoxin VapB
MALNLKNLDVERLVDEITGITGESKTEAVRRALEERRARLRFRVAERRRVERIQRFLSNEVWPRVPEEQRGHSPGRAERERILGYGEEGA